MKKKNRLKILLMLSLLLVLTSCVNTSDKGQRKTIHTRNGKKMTKEQADEFDKNAIENAEYYEDIYKAVENNRLREQGGINIELIDVLKIVENDEKIIVYGVIAYPKGYEMFTVLPFLKKDENGKTLYSTPLVNASVTYEGYEDEDVGMEFVKPLFQSLNHFGRDKITIPEKKNFQFFLLRTREKAESIKVNGYKPDEIIEHEVVDQDLNKQKSYFVYFNDIEMSGKFDDMEIIFE